MQRVREKTLKPNDYKKMIQKLDIENFELKTSYVFETKSTLVNLLRLEEYLNEIRRCVSSDMREIKLKYLKSDYLNKSSIIDSLSLNKPKVSKKRIEMQKKLDRELGPYQNLLDIIDDYLQQIEEVKEYINNITE
ncbi:MAG: hypothetical protein QMD61_04750 [Methanobacterium sp.]|nr:hypothetical protein [Methanobacterium sp.]